MIAFFSCMTCEEAGCAYANECCCDKAGGYRIYDNPSKQGECFNWPKEEGDGEKYICQKMNDEPNAK